MALMNEFPVITSSQKAGLGVYGTVDTYNSALQNNGAMNPVGSIYYIPAPAQSGSALTTSKGYGSGLWVKYCRYNSTANPAVVTGPAPVVYTDETFTTVSGVYSEGIVAGTGSSASFAGWMLPNSGTVANVGMGTTLFTNTILNGNYVWIAICGFVPSAYLAAGAIYNGLYSGTGNFAVAAQAAGSIAYRPAGYVVGAVTSNIGDILVDLPIF